MFNLFDNNELRQCLTSGYLSEYQIEFVWPSNENTNKYSDFILEALRSRDFRVVFWLMSQVYPDVDPFVVFDPVQSAKHGIISAVKWLFPAESGSTVSTMMSAAVENKRYDVCKWLTENGVEFGAREIDSIDKSNNVDMMSLIKWDKGLTLADAAFWGQMNCLRYAHANGFVWNSLVCSAAAVGGNLHCLKYLHANSCPWDRFVIPSALDQLEDCIDTKDFDQAYHISKCVEYARMHGCPEGDEN